MTSDVRFAELPSGGQVAYHCSSDERAPVIVHPTDGPFPLDLLHDEPMYDRFLRTLGQAGRVVLFDRPGVGSSDPFDRDRDLVGQTADVIPTVLDAIGAPTAWIVGSELTLIARTIERHGDRLAGAVLVNPISPRHLKQVESAAIERERTPLTFVQPSRADDPEYQAWAARALRLAVSAADWAEFVVAQRASLDRWLAERRPVRLAQPMMMIRRRNALDPQASRFIEAVFPDAETVTIEGEDAGVGSLDAGLVGEIAAAFITGSPIAAAVERELIAVLFTDLVNSTPIAAARGDNAWRSTLDRYEAAVRSVVGRHHGTVVKHTGDGVLATFATGTEAIAAATSIRSATADLGLEGRAGIHVGEVELRDDDIGGIAVHLAARVMGEAGPGQIVVTSTVAESTLGGVHRFDELGERSLKGIDRPWRLLALSAERPG